MNAKLFSLAALQGCLLVGLCLASRGLVQAAQPPMRLNADMEAEPLATNCYVIRSYAQVPTWGRVAGNELLYVVGHQALLVNTPWNDQQTQQLLDWCQGVLGAEVVKVIVTHTHADCMGGIAVLTNRHIQTIALDRTAQKARQEGKPAPDTLFSQSLRVTLGGKEIEAFYPGAGHTVDNITVWLPEEKILFGGCCVRSAQAKDLGNVADADLRAWPNSLRRLKARYPHAVLVVPGHGNVSGLEAIDHSLELLAKAPTK